MVDAQQLNQNIVKQRYIQILIVVFSLYSIIGICEANMKNDIRIRLNDVKNHIVVFREKPILDASKPTCDLHFLRL